MSGCLLQHCKDLSSPFKEIDQMQDTFSQSVAVPTLKRCFNSNWMEKKLPGTQKLDIKAWILASSSWRGFTTRSGIRRKEQPFRRLQSPPKPLPVPLRNLSFESKLMLGSLVNNATASGSASTSSTWSTVEDTAWPLRPPCIWPKKDQSPFTMPPAAMALGYRSEVR